MGSRPIRVCLHWRFSMFLIMVDFFEFVRPFLRTLNAAHCKKTKLENRVTEFRAKFIALILKFEKFMISCLERNALNHYQNILKYQKNLHINQMDQIFKTIFVCRLLEFLTFQNQQKSQQPATCENNLPN